MSDKKIRLGVKLTILILICLFSSLIAVLFKHRYGYWERIGDYWWDYPFRSDVLLLPDEKLMFLGCNCPQSHNPSNWSISQLVLEDTPSAIYDLKSKKIDKFNIPTDIIYLPYGVLLKNNKLLLTYVYNPNGENKNYSNVSSGEAYTSMAVVDLKTARIEKVIPNKIKKSYSCRHVSTTFTLLGNGNVLIINFKDDVAEVFNPTTNTTKLLSIKTHKEPGSTVVPYGKSKALIIGETTDAFRVSPSRINGSLEENILEYDSILEYDDSTGKCNSIGRVLRREVPEASVINQSLIIVGGRINFSSGATRSSRHIEIFDLQNNTSRIVETFKAKRNGGTFSIVPINSRYILIVGGWWGTYPFYHTQRTTEIIDLKNNKIFFGPQTAERTAAPWVFKLASGNILVVDSLWEIQKYNVKGLDNE